MPPADPSLQAIAAPAIAPPPAIPLDAASADEGSETAPETDETSATDAAPLQPAILPETLAQPLPQPLPIGPAVALGVTTTPPASVRRSGQAAASPAASSLAAGGSAGPAASGAPVEQTVEAAPVGAKPAGAITTDEAGPGRPKEAVRPEAGPQASAASPAGPADFAAHLAQAANPAAPLAAQSLPGAAATPVPGGGEASRTATAVPIGDVPVEIGLRALDGSSRFDIRLSPEDLGRIDVKLDIDGEGRIRAHLVVERPETLAFLQRDGDNLHRAFEQAGFKPAETGIAFSLRDPGGDAGGGRNGSGENGQRARPPAGARQDREAGLDAARTAWRTLRAGRAGIDLRI